jgi:hypothetical protein
VSPSTAALPGHSTPGFPIGDAELRELVVLESRELLRATDQPRWPRMPVLVAQGEQIEFIIRGSWRSRWPRVLGAQRVNPGDAI